jgi:beta-phosphoglucomutase
MMKPRVSFMQKQAISGVIFDLDGVICSTDESHYEAWKAIADQEGIVFDRRINNRLRGVSRMASLEIILQKAHRPYSEEEKEALCAKKNALYRELLGQMSPASVSPDVLLTLKSLREKKIPMAIGSSSKNTGLILQRIGLEKAFDAIADGNEITHSKPNPEVFLLAARKLGLPPQRCLVVEDAESGLEAAKNGGFVSAGIGPSKDDPLAEHSLTKLSDILALF